ncbi:MAG: helix-turn-helix domain-containing protein [Planctomycetaceae bacterium]|jgi:excisionase family DNA binding protein|nr:helix-turn-helix domain-containing protein [Planctomycetaceae bacterium]
MTKNTEIERLAYSIKEVAATLGVSSRTVHTLVKDGKLEHFRIGVRVLVETGALRRFIESRSSRPPMTPENECNSTALQGGENG